MNKRINISTEDYPRCAQCELPVEQFIVEDTGHSLICTAICHNSVETAEIQDADLEDVDLGTYMTAEAFGPSASGRYLLQGEIMDQETKEVEEQVQPTDPPAPGSTLVREQEEVSSIDDTEEPNVEELSEDETETESEAGDKEPEDGQAEDGELEDPENTEDEGLL